VLWRPGWFGAKPSVVLKAGLPAWAAVGDPNAAVDDAQPLVLGAQFAGSGAAPPDVSVVFVNQAAAAASGDAVPTRRRRVGVRGTRYVGLASMLRGNDRSGRVRVDPSAQRVTLDGDDLGAEPAEHVPLTRLYHL
jgi:urease subunit alpha